MASPRKEQISELMADGVIDDDELAALTKDDLRDMVELLNLEIIDKDKEITALSNEISKGGKKKGKYGGDTELDSLREQMTQLSDRLQATEQERDNYREDLADVRAKFENLNEEKRTVEGSLKSTRKALDDAEKELQNISESNRQSLRKSQEFSKQKKESQSEQIRLFEGNSYKTYVLFIQIS